MNVLTVHNYYKKSGGEDVVVSNEANMLSKQGHQVYSYFRNNKELDKGGIISKLKLVIDTVFSLRTYREVRRIIREKKIDIVHVHNTLPLISPAVYYAARSMKVPVVQTVHNFRLQCPAATFYRNNSICEDCTSKGLRCSVKHGCYRDSKLQTLAVATSMGIHRLLGIYRKIYYICLTDFNKAKLLSDKALRLRDNQVFVKPNFVYDTGLDRAYGLDSRLDQYLVIGRLEKLKGTDVILRTWKELGDKAPKLVFCGTGDLEKQARAYVAKHQISNVEFKGFVDNDKLKELINTSKALLFAPQWYEGFGIVIAEAFSCATPVVASNIGNPGNLVNDGYSGLTFTYNSTSDMQRAILKLEALENEEYIQLQKHALKEASKYTATANYSQLIGIYKSIISNEKQGKTIK